MKKPKATPEQIRASLVKAIEDGAIRSFADQSDAIANHGPTDYGTQGPLTNLEYKARRMYLIYIMNTENPRIIP